MTTPTAKLPSLASKTGTEAEVMPTRTNAGNIAGGTTAMNTAALGGINTTKIGTAPKAEKPKYTRLMSGRTGGKFLKVTRPKYARPNPSSEADAGDMSHYTPPKFTQ